MSDRNRAITILKEARELLASHLTDRVLESADEILEDSQGLTYISEIDEIYEKVGARLQHINIMLANLPAEKEEPEAQQSTETAFGDSISAGLDESDVQVSYNYEQLAIESSMGDPPPALPAPTGTATTQAAEPISFRTFAAQVQTKNVEGAGQCLAALFAIDLERGHRCAEDFFKKMEQNPETIGKAMLLRKKIAENSINGALMLLYECFGLQPHESISIIDKLKTML